MMLYTKANDFKVGYSLSKKHGKAVKRNRIKRLLRASTREVFKDLDIKYHVVFLPRVQDEYSFKDSFRIPHSFNNLSDFSLISSFFTA